ncbi:MAG: TlpA disulfide reductase family protein [Ferruginibacter sp.]
MRAVYFIILFVGTTITTHSQQIKKWKITDIVEMIDKSDSVLIINFWATFCKPCVEEIPDLIKYATKYKKEKVALHLISLDLADYYPAKIKKFVAVKKYAANIAWLDESNADYFCPFISPDWSGSIPATLFVNKKNGYRKFYEKKLSAADIENEIKLSLKYN